MVQFEQETKKGDAKLAGLSALVLAAMGLLVLGLWYVQIISTKRYEDTMRQQYYRTVRLPAPRGVILDRFGKPLAENRPSFNINIYLEQLSALYRTEYQRWKSRYRDDRKTPQERKEFLLEAQLPSDIVPPAHDEFGNFEWGNFTRYVTVRRLTDRLAQELNATIEIDFGRFNQHWFQERSMPFTILSDITLDQVSKFLSLLDRPPGFDLDVGSMRTYPNGETACHILGYLRLANNESLDGEERANYYLQDFTGGGSMEAHLNIVLKGKPGLSRIKVDNIGYRVSESIAHEPEPGRNVILTLDLGLQQFAAQALSEADPDEPVRGAVVVMNPKNGDILALVSLPGFDPNQFVPRISHATWREYQQPDAKLLQSRSFYSLYQPGSIFKIIVGIAALHNGVCDPHATFRTTHGTWIGNHKFRDLAPAGDYTFARAFAKSSNDYFIEMGSRVSRKEITRIAHEFGFKRLYDLPIGPMSSGNIPDDAFMDRWVIPGKQVWTAGNQANLSIGQGELDVTPLQIATMLSGVANEGVIYEPRLVDRYETSVYSSSGTVETETPPRKSWRVNVDPKVYPIIKDALRMDVGDRTNGTGYRADIEGYEIGGKTGTADSTSRRTTWFASMAPMDDPNYVVVVMVEDGHYGGTTCAPVARKIYEYILAQNTADEGAEEPTGDLATTDF